jgi:hypothetical protein
MLPPCRTQFAAKTLPMRGFPDPPGPVMRVYVPVGQPWGKSFRSQGSAIGRCFIFSLLLAALVSSCRPKHHHRTYGKPCRQVDELQANKGAF